MRRFDKGDRVVHEQYGPGTLADVNEVHTVIDFDEHGVRKFVTSMVSLERTVIPAPIRPVKDKRASRARTSG
jgi:hypothetical protein